MVYLTVHQARPSWLAAVPWNYQDVPIVDDDSQMAWDGQREYGLTFGDSIDLGM
ncbi:hypothetical protein MPRS_54890 [Mycobacterium paraseoulense]|nr:hypothetical protein MPRS_54890 [Mycobacterium paraseoulense]